MPVVQLTRRDFLCDQEGKSLSDFLADSELPFDAVLEFFNRQDQQLRMIEVASVQKSPPLAAVVEELEAIPAVQAFLSASDANGKKQLEQSVTILVRLVMDRLGWQVVPHTTVR